MGIFDSLFGVHNTDKQDDATAAANKALSANQATNTGLLQGAANQASQSLTGGTNSALASLLAGFGSANGDLSSYGQQAQAALGNGVQQGVGTITSSNQAFQPFLANGTAANGMLGNALGLNGAAGNAAATSAFQHAPGYDYAVKQATDAAMAKAASLGMAASGNTLDAITRLSSNLADQDYGSWLDRLTGSSGQGMQAASAISGNNAAAGGLQANGGSVLASLLSQTGSGLSTNDKTLGTNQANLQSGLGNSLAGVQTGLGNNLSSLNSLTTSGLNQNNLTLAGAQDAASNANNGILSNLLGSVGTSFLGGTASGKALTSAFAKL